MRTTGNKAQLLLRVNEVLRSEVAVSPICLDDPSVQYISFTEVRLRLELTARNLSSSGKRNALISRLIRSDSQSAAASLSLHMGTTEADGTRDDGVDHGSPATSG
jgi:hypothetical protein